jgi:hypothetical protein
MIGFRKPTRIVEVDLAKNTVLELGRNLVTLRSAECQLGKQRYCLFEVTLDPREDVNDHKRRLIEGCDDQ